MRESMRNLSIRDALTGLFNRRYMQEALEQEQHRTRRNGAQMALVMIDIDHFSTITTRSATTAATPSCARSGPSSGAACAGATFACRFGGEEFALILSPSTIEGARQRAEKIREDAATSPGESHEPGSRRITLSLGVSIFPEHAFDAAALIKTADVALYRAKRDGRNRVVMSDERAEPMPDREGSIVDSERAVRNGAA